MDLKKEEELWVIQEMQEVIVIPPNTG